VARPPIRPPHPGRLARPARQSTTAPDRHYCACRRTTPERHRWGVLATASGPPGTVHAGRARHRRPRPNGPGRFQPGDRPVRI